MNKPLFQHTICIKGAGEMASGIACRLHKANFKKIAMLETDNPSAVRRRVSFSEAVYDGSQTVEGISAVNINGLEEMESAWETGRIAIAIDPDWQLLGYPFDVVVDAILAKKNLGTCCRDARLVIGLGPGFTAGKDVDYVIETQRGHNLGRVLEKGSAVDNTGIPGNIGGYTSERVLRSPGEGFFKPQKEIGDLVEKNTVLGVVGDSPVQAQIGGVVRGLIRGDIKVYKGMKLGDVDPRGNPEYCSTVSEKARALGGAVLETILKRFNH
ncbi:EF2563 family selenium-dependent molybdenum hydroxylase system protein [bacterium]|nr:EF2563 family selenium-dependent molybdenum hydroxylase system protein [bacterium]